MSHVSYALLEIVAGP